jgi:engulfment and cell motility protein 1
MQGAWFVNAVPLSSNISASTTAPSNRKPWRFIRLDHSQTYLHYVDTSTKFPVRAGIEDLPERLDVSLIHEIAVGTCAAPPQVVTVLDPHDHVPAGPTSAPSPLSFSILAEEEGKVLANLVATDASRWADWTDGLNLLRKDGGGHVQSQETAEFVQALTDIGLKIKLLGEMMTSCENMFCF